MSSYIFSPDIVRIVFVVGVMVSVLFYERMQLTTGGAIVPAYLALTLENPIQLVTTVAAGFLTWLIVNKVIVRRTILYGRRKFEIELLVGLCLVGLSLAIDGVEHILTLNVVAVSTIGFLVPGIIAHDMFRQGPQKTMIAIAATTAVLGCLLVVYLTVLQVFNITTRPAALVTNITGFPPSLLLVAIAISVIVSMLVFDQLGARCGGFIGGAYMAFMLPRWGDLLFEAAVAFLTWFVVVKILMPRLLLFGRRKLSTMVLFGALIGWALDIGVRLVTDGHVEPGTGLPVMTLMVPALIANDAQRQGWGRTLLGISMGATGVDGLINLLSALLIALGVIHISRNLLSPAQAYGPFVVLGLAAIFTLGVQRVLQRRAARPSFGSGVSTG